MEFRTLGPIELWSDGYRHDLGSGRTVTLLAVLLLAPRAIVPVETLIDRLWETEPPPKARQSLSVYMARLRSSLRHAVGAGAQVVGRAQSGYLLEVDPESVDIHRFRRLRREAQALGVSGDSAHASSLLREADELWRGQALTGVRAEWAVRMRDALEEERRAGIIERIGYDLQLGREADLTGELGQLLTRYPLDETLVGLQMTALYRNGRQSDALGLYRETRSRLIDEQGAEPSAALAELHQRMLVGDPELAGGLGARFAIRSRSPDSLPGEVTDFVGRADELAVLTGPHGSGQFVAVIEGMPGVGKTALAARVARLAGAQYPDGMLYLNLHSHDPGRPPLDPSEALGQLLRMLSVPSAQIPQSVGGRAALWRAHVGRRRAIVILDDADGREQIRPLLPLSGRCLVLITSRRTLSGLAGAHQVTLDVLSADDAFNLFRQAAGQVEVLDAERVAAAVCLCGGLPLAIRAAAARMARAGSSVLEDVMHEWTQSPAWISGSDGRRQQVTAAFDVSYDGLPPGAQRVFRRLGLSPCATHGPGAAAALGGCAPDEAQDALRALVDCHLLIPTQEGHYRLHDLVRRYAASRVRQEDSEADQGAAIARLLDYYLCEADRADRCLHPLRRRPAVSAPDAPRGGSLTTPGSAANWLESEWRNLLQAADFGGRHEWKQACADLSALLADFLVVGGHWDEAITAHTLGLRASRYLADPVRTAQSALALAVVRQQVGQHGAAMALAEEAAAIYRSIGDQRGEAEALDQVGLANQRTGRFREALAYFREAQSLYVAAQDRRGVADSRSHSAIACWHLGRYSEARESFRDALALYREVGDRRGEAKALNNLGKVHLYGGQLAEAQDAYQESLRIFRIIGGPQNEAILHHAIGAVHLQQGDYERALPTLQQALAAFRGLGDLPDEADALNDIGATYLRAGNPDEALIHHQKALMIAEQLGDLSPRLKATRLIAETHRSAGRHTEALQHYESALKLAREIGDQYEEGKALEGIAELTLYTQRHDAARIVLRQALDIFQRLGVPEADTARTRIESVGPGRVQNAS